MRMQILSLIAKWHVGTGRHTPPRATMEAMADTICDVIRDEIKPWGLSECWRVAMKSTDFIPQGSGLIKAWRDEVSRSPRGDMRIGHDKKAHECNYCGVVALRLGSVLPMPTQDEIELSRQPVTEGELNCVRRTVLGNPMLMRFWGERRQSPYFGMI